MKSKDQYNWMQHYCPGDFKTMRKLMIEAVFSTDISQHFGNVAQFKSMVDLKEFAPDKGLDK